MNIKERAAYAWTRILDLFKPKKPEIEVEIEEMDDKASEERQENVSSLFPEDVPAPDPENVPESPIPDRIGEEEAVPSRMTEEYKAWMEEHSDITADGLSQDSIVRKSFEKIDRQFLQIKKTPNIFIDRPT